MIFNEDIEAALAAACGELEMTRQEAIRLIIREWLEQYRFLPGHDLQAPVRTALAEPREE
ncbi:hypothetical protein SAMCCGM7_pA0342 (plasmid) [Sinorhizobium americanum CCGM7]|uniref:hypothetical protein n=1 Tax=Sinorhizobium americanum TaxID=194963 RepID=UPI0004D8237A|nr:hypothetical protein [Sinorhizobium americanum]APG86680.1 hypothetical protein SAMCCGM7_pA0342 [Sinorhizobium americanum CCGM7]